MNRPKKIPMRMCVGCKQMKSKRELLRVVKSPQGIISIDLTSKSSGRGAYLCHDIACFEHAIKTRALERALEHPIDSLVFEQLKEELAARAKQ